MMKKSILCCIAILILTIVLAGCGTPPATSAITVTETEAVSTPTVPEAPDASQTPDACSLPQVEQEVQKVHRHMREFDDAAKLASNIAREQLSDSIAELQRIRRDAQDEQIPDCLTNLKTYQVQHMELVIETMIAFMGGTDQQTLDQGISLAREQHDQYILELARLLGLTAVPATVPPAPLESPTP